MSGVDKTCPLADCLCAKHDLPTDGCAHLHGPAWDAERMRAIVQRGIANAAPPCNREQSMSSIGQHLKVAPAG